MLINGGNRGLQRDHQAQWRSSGKALGRPARKGWRKRGGTGGSIQGATWHEQAAVPEIAAGLGSFLPQPPIMYSGHFLNPLAEKKSLDAGVKRGRSRP